MNRNSLGSFRTSFCSEVDPLGGVDRYKVRFGDSYTLCRTVWGDVYNDHGERIHDITEGKTSAEGTLTSGVTNEQK